MPCSIKFCTITDLQIKDVMFELVSVFNNSRFGFDISVVAGVEGDGAILQCKPLSVIPNYISGVFGLKVTPESEKKMEMLEIRSSGLYFQFVF